MTAMKLQKLAYYSQAWHLVWEDRQLFNDRIRAWANGPVAPSLYRQHRGKFRVSAGNFEGDGSKLSPKQRSTVDAVIEFYGCKSGAELSELTHAEAPWRDARIHAGLAPGERGDALIHLDSMAEYYGGLIEPPDDCTHCY